MDLTERYPFSSLRQRPDFSWPGGKRLAFYVALNMEHFILGGRGVDLDREQRAPNVRSYLWRDYGSRVGTWRILDLFEELAMPMAVIANGWMFDYCPEAMDAFKARGDEIIGHGLTNSKPNYDMNEEEEREMIREATKRIADHMGAPPKGWLTPYVDPSDVTTDLLKEEGYTYLLDYGMTDDQPFWVRTRTQPILAMPYTLEINDQPAIVFRRNTAEEFADMIIDHFDEHLHWSARYPTVCVVSLHSFIFGRPFRLKQLRRALRHVLEHKDEVWFASPGEIADYYSSLPEGLQLKAD